jgi:hypothetical protein
LPIYHNWPGFFTGAAAISDATGIDTITLARWAPLAIGLLQLGAVIYLVSALTSDRSVRMLVGWLFVMFNWVGQEYFSPQGLAFGLYLVFVGLVLRLFGETLPGRTRLSPRRRLGLSLLAGQLLFVIVASHQLTPPDARAHPDRIAVRPIAARCVAGLVGAVVGFVRRWRRRHRNVAAAVLIVTPFVALGLNDFDGEMLLRVVLFSSPPIALFCAHALLERHRSDRTQWLRPVLVTAFLLALSPLFLLAH